MPDQESAAPHTRPTPAEAFARMVAGNERFVANTPRHPNQDAASRALSASGQTPFATVLGCSDSRVAAEIIFDQGIGDLFVVRTAGHLLGAEVQASIEFAADALDVPLIVVLGHDNCGAVGAALAAQSGEQVVRGYVRTIVERLGPEVITARARGTLDPEDVAELHIANTAERILEASPRIREQVERGEVGIVGMIYDLVDGKAATVVTHGAV